MSLEDALAHTAMDALPNSETITYYLRQRLGELLPGEFVLNVDGHTHDIASYVRETALAGLPLPTAVLDIQSEWDNRGEILRPTLLNGVLRGVWEGEIFTAVMVTYSHGTCRLLLSTRNEHVCTRLAHALFVHTTRSKNRVQVFLDGSWDTDEDLARDIATVSFDTLILDASLKASLRRDTTQFFTSKDLYARFNAPWKRGLLLTGPPGNGKTHTIRALLHESEHLGLLVKAIHYPGDIPDIFQRARTSAPCTLVFEDLDSLVPPDQRSMLLNELDGMGDNPGLLVIATSNHPEMLDEALLHRPSRFDRIYHFGLPTEPQRRLFLERWNTLLTPADRMDDQQLASVSRATEGFSFAYLKEVMLSAALRCVQGEPGTLFEHTDTEITTLASTARKAALAGAASQ